MANKFFSLSPQKVANISAYSETEQELIKGYIELGKHKLYQRHKGITPVLAKHRTSMFSGSDMDAFDYSEYNSALLKKHLEYACKAGNIPYDEAVIRSPRTLENQAFSSAFFQIIDMALPSVITATVNYAFMDVAEVHNVGWGDQLHFKVNSPDIFTVQSIGKNIRNGAHQRLFAEDIRLTPQKYDVTISQPWYQIAAGMFDMGEWMLRVSLAFSTAISARVYESIDASFATLPTPLQVAGAFTDSAFINLTQRVRAANGGLPVVAMGTLNALSAVLPQNDFLKMELGDEYAKFGYVGNYKGVNLIEIPQVLVNGTANSTLELALNDERIYFFAMGGDKPVKIGFEGDVITKFFDGLRMADGDTTTVTQYFLDVKVATSSTYAIMDLQL